MKKKPLRIAIAQINPTVGDFSGNLERILERCRQADKKRADLAVFSEMAISGYPIWDLANKEKFVRQGLATLRKLSAATRRFKTAVVVGFVDRKPDKKKSYNALAVLYKGKLIHKQYKMLLPTYDVFLEQIFFQPGETCRLFDFKGWRMGASICEDLWDEAYTEKPTRKLSQLGAELVINISASPFHRGVERIRQDLVRNKARANEVAIIYVNQVGAQDDLIFDGRSMACTEKGAIVLRAPAFQEGVFIWATQNTRPEKSMKPDEIADVYEALCLGIKDYCRKNSFERVVIGLSGGIDSALTATLAVDALGADRVLGVTMPGPFSSAGSVDDSGALAERLGIQFRQIEIKTLYHTARAMRPFTEKEEIDLADENFQARLRGLELMYISNKEGRLLLSTGNKSEMAVGYCTLYGDMCGGLSVLGDVYKTDIYRLVRYRNRMGNVIPEATIRKAPSAELRPDQKDRDSLPAYPVLDHILQLYIEAGLSRDEIVKEMRGRASAALVKRVLYLVDRNEYKRRQSAPTLRVSTKAWFGRRMPITNKFRG